MRDQLKAKIYFDEYVAFNVEAYADTKARIAAGKVIPDSVTGAYFSVTDYCYSALVGRYSRGDEILNLVEPFQIWLDSFSEYHASRMKEEPCSRLQWVNLGRETYQEYLNLLSWAVLLRKDQETLAMIGAVIDCHDSGAFCRRGTANYVVGNNRGKDQLLDLLLNTAGLPGPQSDSLEIGGIYKKLLQVCMATPEKRTALMAKYLDGWYVGNKQSPWYNSARDDDSGYIGYWSFEAALVVRLFGIDDEGFADHPHYPKDLARFQG